MKSLFLFLVVVVISCKSTAQWVQTNGPYGGEIHAIAVSGTNIFAGSTYLNGVFLSTNNGTTWSAASTGLPPDPHVRALVISGTNIFVGLNGGGVFLSTNNGGSWNSVNNGLPPSAPIFCLSVSDTTLFAGTVNGGGIYRSTNNGASWTPVNNGLPSDTAHLQIEAIVCQNNNVFIGTATNGIFRSTDNGTNWTYCGFVDTTVYSLTISESNIFAGTWNCGIFCSSDNGLSWSPVNNGLNGLSVNAFAVSPPGSGERNIFAGTGTGGVSLSTNNGASWTAVNNGLPTNYWVLSLASFQDGNGGTNILIGNSRGIYLSTNNGSNWTEVNFGLTGTRVDALISSPGNTNSSNIFAGTRNGIFRSTDNGINWNTVNNGFTSYSVIYATALSVSGGNIFAGIISLNLGVFLSTNQGDSWSLSCSLPDQVTALVTSQSGSNDTNIFAATNSQGIFHSSNNGVIWNQVGGIGLPTNYPPVALVISDTNIFASLWGNGIYLSTNNGANWTAVNNGLPENPYIRTLVVSGSQIFAGTNGDGVFLSTNNGASWTQVNTGLTGASKSVRVLAVLGTNIFAGTGGGVFVSTNYGNSWTEVNTGLPANSDIWSITLDNSYIYASAYTGCVWRRALTDFIPVELTSFSASIKNGKTYLTWKTATETNNRGFEIEKRQKNFDWETIGFLAGAGNSINEHVYNFLESKSINSKSEYRLKQIDFDGSVSFSGIIELDPFLLFTYELGQNFPNPFNPVTNIVYRVAEDGLVSIDLFDNLGNFVQSITSGFHSKGIYTIQLNATTLSSGNYYYQMKSGSFSQTKKLILIK